MSNSNGHHPIDWSSSYINQEWIEKARIRWVDHEEGAEMLGRKPENRKELLSGILINYIVPGKENAPSFFSRLRRDFPDIETRADGSVKTEKKYLQPVGTGNTAYFPPETNPDWLTDPTIPAIFVEGEKKAIALRRYFYERDEQVLIIAVPGVWNFRNRETLRDTLGHTWAYVRVFLPEFERIAWEGRSVKILFDANAISNPDVRNARRALGSKLTERGANVRVVDLLPAPGVNGLDDFLGKYGVAAFEKFWQETPGVPARMELEDAKAVAIQVQEAIPTNPSAAVTERALIALAQVRQDAPEVWVGVATELKKVGQVRFVESQIKARTSVGKQIAESRNRLLRLVGADDSPEVKKPVIDTGGNIDLPVVTREAWKVLQARNTGPHLFLRSGIPVRLERDEAGRPRLNELTADRLRYELAEAADWWENQDSIPPPMEVVKNLLASPEMPLPCLRRITSVPIFASDGRLIDTPGFDRESGIFYLPAADFEAVALPETITVELVNEANRILCNELLVDFPFATTADRDNAVALCVLGAVRELIGENSTPNHAVEASIRAAGKGKLARACAGIFAGDELASTPPLETEKEWKDMITSELLSGSPAVLIDNVVGTLKSPALCVAWTEPYWKDRLFHKQQMARLPILCLWITTANNTSLGEDERTRSVRIRLEPATARPEERTGFRHENLDLWCRENRANLVWAVHVLVKWWLQAGRPLPVGVQSTRHAEWCRVIGGVLQCAGFKDFLGNQLEFAQTASTETEIYPAFCEAWWYWAHHETSEKERERRIKAAFTKDLVELARNIEGFPLSHNPNGHVNSLGSWLKSCRGRRIDSREEENGRTVLRVYTISKSPKRSGGCYPWKIELLEEVWTDQ